MNKIIIAGRLGRDPELKTANTGLELVNFVVAVDRRAKKGEDRKTDWINCTAFGKTAAFIQNYYHKGDGITVVGRLESNTSESNGERRTYWGVTVEEVEFPVGGKKQSDTGTANPVVLADTTAVETNEDLPF